MYPGSVKRIFPFSFWISHDVSHGNTSVFNSKLNLNSPGAQEQSGNNVGEDDDEGFCEGRLEGKFDGADDDDGTSEIDGAAVGEKVPQTISILSLS